MRRYKLAKNRILNETNHLDLEDLYQLKLIRRHMAAKKNKKDLFDYDLETDFV
ncbi:hypothetical protein KY336_04935 [Candidatus Woesearchaeota archaeon]|nr:hypothetical protein [Candidatus Woesearchaeota archaeon]